METSQEGKVKERVFLPCKSSRSMFIALAFISLHPHLFPAPHLTHHSLHYLPALSPCLSHNPCHQFSNQTSSQKHSLKLQSESSSSPAQKFLIPPAHSKFSMAFETLLYLLPTPKGKYSLSISAYQGWD